MNVLLDANGIAHWKYHATKAENPSNGMLLAVSELVGEIRDRFNPTRLVACIDGKGNWRKQRHPAYKQNRKPLELDLTSQLDLLADTMHKAGAEVMIRHGFEADDVIATLTTQIDGSIVVVSSDKDLMQLVSESVLQFDPRPKADGTTKLYDSEAVRVKMGVEPHRIVDLLSLWGDSSDNVPGVPGWGEVTSRACVNQTQSLEEAIRKAESGYLTGITPRLQKSLVENQDLLWLSRDLVSLRYDVPIVEVAA